MSERSSDIEFDFFDEPETEEAPPRTRPARRGGGPPRVRPPAGGFTPLLRLIGLVAFAILVVVVLVAWVQSCREDNKRSTYSNYMGEVQVVANDSEQIGVELSSLLTTPGIKLPELEQQLGGLAQQQEQGVTQAREIVPPGTLRPENQASIEALELRASGLRRLEDAFRQTADSDDDSAAGQTLATQVQRLLASDVIWSDLFQEPSVAELQRQGITGVKVPSSQFLTNDDLATSRLMTSIYRRIKGAATGGTPSGIHGNALVSTKALPGGQTLSTDQDNIVTATADLRFEVTIENSGEAQEVQVPVRLTIQQTPQPIVKTATVDLINPGEQKTVTFRNLGQIVQFAQKTNVKVVVEPVPAESNTSNNSATYPVTFTLTPPS